MQKFINFDIDTTFDSTKIIENAIFKGDTLTLTIKVFSKGVLVDLSNQIVDLVLLKADGKPVEGVQKNISGGVVTATLSQQATLCEGVVRGTLQITESSTSHISTNEFTYLVLSSIADSVLEASKVEINTLEEVLTTIANNENIINQYKDLINSTWNTTDSIQALNDINTSIDSHLSSLQSSNNLATSNINTLKSENTQATSNTGSLHTENVNADAKLEQFRLYDTSNIVPQITNIKKPIISFCFDDGYSEDNLTYSIFKEFGFVCSFALITDTQIGKNAVDTYRKYEKEGFSVNSHTCTHLNLSDATNSLYTASYEIIEAKNKLNHWGFHSNGLVAPYSAINDKYMDLVNQNYDYAFTIYTGILGADNKGHVNKKNDIHKLYRINLTSNDTTAIKSAIDNCIAEDGCLFFYDHRVGVSGYVTETKLREILSYVKTKTDSGLCVVKNNDDAVSSFFGMTLSNSKKTKMTTNLAKSLDSVSASLDSNWFYSNHGVSLNETYSAAAVNGEMVGTISFPQTITTSKECSLQTKIDLSNIDMTNYTNQTVLFSLDIWTSTEQQIKTTLEGRFYKNGVMDTTHVKEVNITSKRQTFTFLLTPYASQQYDYLLLYPRFHFNAEVAGGFSIKIANPRVAICNSLNNINRNDKIDTGWINLTLLNGVTNNDAANPLRYRKINNQVFIKGVGSNITATGTIIANLPVEFRPPTAVWFAMPGTSNRFNRFVIGSGGDIKFEATDFTGTLAAADFYPINFSFLID